MDSGHEVECGETVAGEGKGDEWADESSKALVTEAPSSDAASCSGETSVTDAGANEISVFTTCCGCRQVSPAPRILACFHTACLRCLGDCIAPRGSISCPECQYVTTGYPSVQALPAINVFPLHATNHVTDQGEQQVVVAEELEDSGAPGMTDGGSSGDEQTTEKSSCSNVDDRANGKPPQVKATQDCQDCLEDAVATASFVCAECDLFLCEMHSTHHRKSRRTAKHVLHQLPHCTDVTKQLRFTTERPHCRTNIDTCTKEGPEDLPTCFTHLEQPLTKLCLPCSALLCERCERLGHHSRHGHEVVVLDPVSFASTAISHLGFIQALQEELYQPLSALNVTATKISKIVDDVNDNAGQASKAITDAADCLIELIEKRKTRLLNEIDILRWHKLKNLEVQHQEIKSQSQSIQRGIHLVDSINQAAMATNTQPSPLAHARLLQIAALLRPSFKKKLEEVHCLDLMPCENAAIQYVPKWSMLEKHLTELGLGFVLLPAVVLDGVGAAVVNKPIALQLRPALCVSSSRNNVIPVAPAKSALTVSCVPKRASKAAVKPGEDGLDGQRDEEQSLHPELQANQAGKPILTACYNLAQEGGHQLFVQHDGVDINGSPFQLMSSKCEFLFAPRDCFGRITLSKGQDYLFFKGEGIAFGTMGLSSGSCVWKMRIRSHRSGVQDKSHWSDIIFGVAYRSASVKKAATPTKQRCSKVWGCDGTGKQYSSSEAGRCYEHGYPWAVPTYTSYHWSIESRSGFMDLHLEFDYEAGILCVTNDKSVCMLTNVGSEENHDLYPFVSCHKSTTEDVNCFEVSLLPSYSQH